MGGIKKFKNFEEANQHVFDEFYSSKFNYAKAQKFFSGFANFEKGVYSAGLYKFKSFALARNFDLKKRIENSIRRKSK